MKKILDKFNTHDLETVVERGLNFIKSIDAEDKLIILHHNDLDGYSSAALFMVALDKLGAGKVDAYDMNAEKLEQFTKSQKITEYDKLIILDMDVPQLRNSLIALKSDILIIDHHIPRKNLNVKNITYINPRFQDDEIYQPVSYVSYKFLSKLVDIKEREWVAVLGTISDYAYEDCKDLLEKWIDIKDKEDVTKTKFWKIGNMLYSSILLADLEDKRHLKQRDILRLLINSENVESIKSNYMIKEADEDFGKIYEKTKKEFWDNAEEMDGIIISTIRPAIEKIGSPIVTEISTKHKDKIIFLFEKRGDYFKISARCQSGCIHLGKLMEKCCSGGGHRHAAGGSIKLDELSEFKKKLNKEVHSFKGS